jgi:hypothetical protein
METPEKIRSAMLPNDWVTSLDLSDAYLHIPICPKHRKFLRFAYQGRVWQFRALPFGLAPAPWLFTFLAEQIKVLAQRSGIIMDVCLDDWLLRSQSKEVLISQTRWILAKCVYLGLQVNMEKSELIPAQDFVLLGYRLRNHLHHVQPSEKKKVTFSPRDSFSHGEACSSWQNASEKYSVFV